MILELNEETDEETIISIIENTEMKIKSLNNQTKTLENRLEKLKELLENKRSEQTLKG